MVTKAISKKQEKNPMNLKESRIRMFLLDYMVEPKGCSKIDVHVYKHNAGRVNYWYRDETTNKIDIKSYYFSHNNNEIRVYDDNKLVITIDMS